MGSIEGKEVTGRGLRTLIGAVEAEGFALEPLFEGLPVDLATLRSGRGFHSWALFADIMERLDQQCTADYTLEDFARRVVAMPIPHTFKEVAHVIASVRQLYHFNSRWAVQADLRCISSTCTDLPDGRLRVTMSLPTRLRGSVPLFRFATGVLSGLPRMIGDPLAEVVPEIGPHGGTYLVALPPRAPLMRRLRRALGSFGGYPTTLLQQLEAQQAEIMEQNRALRASEERWRSLAENAPDLIMVVAPDGHLRSINRPGHGQSLDELVAIGDRPAMSTALRRAAETNALQTLEVRGRDGVSVHVGRLRALGDGAEILVMLTDVTQQKRAEEALRRSEAQLQQSQKLESIGRLAGGIAHDFNNILSVVLGYSALLLRKLPTDSEEAADVQQISDAGERAAALTRQILAYSRQAVLAPVVTDLNDIVRRSEQLLARMIGEDIALRVRLDPELRRVKVDPTQMEQVIVNLVLNARDAMLGGGTIILETRNVELDAAYASTHGECKPGPHVLLAVSDTGCGIAEAERALIFEPFFTTKAPGSGTGLGLSMVRGIVQQSGGNIWVYSEVGIGTTMKLHFPATLEAMAPAPAKVSTPARRGDETILLVEDDARVRAVTSAILVEHGYRVLAAGSPIEALELFAALDEPVHLLLTDVIMPGMSGRALADRLGTLRVLYMSGYAEATIAHRGILEPGVTLLQKPFSIESLTRCVREVLDA